MEGSSGTWDLQHLQLCEQPGWPGTEHMGIPQWGIPKAPGFVKDTAKLFVLVCWFGFFFSLQIGINLQESKHFAIWQGCVCGGHLGDGGKFPTEGGC